MGGDYGRGFWSVALLLRCVGLAVGLAFCSLAPSIAFADIPEGAVPAKVPCGGFCTQPLSYYQNTYPMWVSFTKVEEEHESETWFGAVLACPSSSPYLNVDYSDPRSGSYCTGAPPECPIPAGTVSKIKSSSPLGSSTCYQNCLTQTRPDGGIYLMILASGQRIYWYKGTSTGEYCDAPSGAESAPPFENYTDEDGCYMGLDGRYCPSGGGSCPNSATAPDGGVYCRTPPDAEPCNEGGGPSGESYCGPGDPNYEEPSDSDGNSDSDGDGIPNKDDPAPEDPDADGDGTPDGEQDGDGNGIPDGEPGGIDDGEGDGNEPGDGHHDGGTCEPGERVEPECSENMDAIQCALAIELFHVRCDATTEHRDFVGDEEYLEGPSITSSEDGDGDGQPDNAIPSATLDAGTVVAGLSEDTISFGNLACPADRTFSMPGAFGGSFTLSWEPICDWAAMVRPIVIALGYLMSALIILRKFSGGSD